MMKAEEAVEIKEYEEPNGSKIWMVELPDGRIHLTEINPKSHDITSLEDMENALKEPQKTVSTQESNEEEDEAVPSAKWRIIFSATVAVLFFVAAATGIWFLVGSTKKLTNSREPMEEGSTEITSLTTIAPTKTEITSLTTISPTTMPELAWPLNGDSGLFCSKGVDIEKVLCSGQDCNTEGFEYCEIDCEIESCDNAIVTKSILTCNVDSCNFMEAEISNVTCQSQSCSSSNFDKSFVNCNAYGSCNQESILYEGTTPPSLVTSRFKSSAAICAIDACIDAEFLACSCCDGDGCPENDSLGEVLPSCQTGIAGFCGSFYLGKNCAEWGNPICNDVESVLPSGGKHSNYTIKVCEKEECNGILTSLEDTVGLCDSSSCNDGAHIETSFIDCVSGSCNFATVQNSTIRCMEKSCMSSLFKHSVVDCEVLGSCSRGPSDFYNGNDPYTQFHSSAVKCTTGACSISDFYPCSCCDGEGCPVWDLEGNNLPSCQDDLESFCNSTHSGKTCAEWGNPFCMEI